MVYARDTHCCRCGQIVDKTIPYRDPYTDSVNMNSKSVDHLIARVRRPDLAEDPANLALAHLGCNLSAGDRGLEETWGLGTPSQAW